VPAQSCLDHWLFCGNQGTKLYHHSPFMLWCYTGVSIKGRKNKGLVRISANLALNSLLQSDATGNVLVIYPTVFHRRYMTINKVHPRKRNFLLNYGTLVVLQIINAADQYFIHQWMVQNFVIIVAFLLLILISILYLVLQ
jgi:hypothetical protein